MDIRLKRTPGIYLVGFMGSGKTTIGRLVAERLGWQFVDVDDDIEQREGTSISSIFETRGEAAFRRLETEAIRARVCAIECGIPTVMALGGGAFVEEANYQLLENNGISVWLDCPLELARQRVERFAHRPLARDPAKFAALYEKRRPFYSRADVRIVIEDDDAERAAGEILALPVFQ
ncbi:MAG: shikimate kinase [Acidobacteria bacterium]|nr:shikimate kinase [Acidobacteriota bacterium]